MIRPILTWPDDRLRAQCRPVDDIAKFRTLAEDMLETMYAAPGRGLAAPQVGIDLRLFVMDAGWKTGTPTPCVCFNPQIIAMGTETVASEEGCLSLPGVTGRVRRAREITLQYQDLDGEVQRVALQGFEALCAQHETDHLNGLLIFDHLDETNRAAFLSAYEAA